MCMKQKVWVALAVVQYEPRCCGLSGTRQQAYGDTYALAAQQCGLPEMTEAYKVFCVYVFCLGIGKYEAAPKSASLSCISPDM